MNSYGNTVALSFVFKIGTFLILITRESAAVHRSQYRVVGTYGWIRNTDDAFLACDVVLVHRENAFLWARILEANECKPSPDSALGVALHLHTKTISCRNNLVTSISKHYRVIIVK